MNSSANTRQPTIIFASLLLATSMILALLVALSQHQPAHAAPTTTYVSGPIITHTTWTVAGSPYVMTGNVIVNPGITLTIEPGVTVMGQQDSISLRVEGYLQAIGMLANPITFTSMLNSGPSQWSALNFIGGSGNLEHVNLRYSSAGLCVGPLGSNNAQVMVKNSEIHHNEQGFCMWSDNIVAPQLLMENTIIRDNVEYAADVTLNALAGLHMTDVTFSNNGFNRIHIYTSYFPDPTSQTLITDTDLIAQPGLEGYEIYGDSGGNELIVPTGITLTVEPGVTIMGSDDANSKTTVIVWGHLEAVGSITNPITFTSAANTGASEWWGISIGGSGNFEWVTVRYSDWGIGIWDTPDSTNPVIIKNSIIHDNESAILFEDYYQDIRTVSIEDTLIHHNTTPVLVDKAALPGLNLVNTQFQENISNRIFIYIDGTRPISDTVVLTSQPGLEGYEVAEIGDLIIPEGITLTLKPGVTFMMPEISRLLVGGHLEALGTASAPITFTSALNTGAGQWGSIGIGGNTATGAAHFDHVTLRYSISGIGVHNHLSDSLVEIENSTLRDNSDYAMQANLHTIHHLVMTEVTFIDNGYDRIFIQTDWPSSNFVAATILTAQPGLEGYEMNGGNFNVPTDITLTLKPHVILMMPEFASIRVEGRLQTNSTPTQPVTITSVLDSGVGEWAGLIIGEGEGHLQHTTVRYGESNITVLSPTASLYLTHSQVISGDYGLLLVGGETTVHCSTITHNSNNGILIPPNTSPNVNIFSSSLFNNSNFGLLNQGNNLVAAQHNWWGAADGPSGLGSGSGDAISGTVTFEPWLSQPECLTAPTLAFTTADYSVTEGMETAVLTLTLNYAPATTVTVNYTTSGGTATPGSDYVPVSGALTFAPGSITQTITIPIVDDAVVEGDETVLVALDGVENAVLVEGETAVLTIHDNDDNDPNYTLHLPLITKP